MRNENIILWPRTTLTTRTRTYCTPRIDKKEKYTHGGADSLFDYFFVFVIILSFL